MVSRFTFHPSQRLITFLISLFIVGVLGFQALATFRVLCPPAMLQRFGLQEIACEPETWPFMNYPMYSEVHEEGAAVPRYQLTGVLADGREVPLTQEDFGLTFFQFQPVLNAVLAEDYGYLESFIADYAARHETALVALRLHNAPILVQRDGLEERESELVVELDVQPAPEEQS